MSTLIATGAFLLSFHFLAFHFYLFIFNLFIFTPIATGSFLSFHFCVFPDVCFQRECQPRFYHFTNVECVSSCVFSLHKLICISCRGKVCLPVAEQCAIRKEKVLHQPSLRYNISPWAWPWPPNLDFDCKHDHQIRTLPWPEPHHASPWPWPQCITLTSQIGATPFQNKTYWFNWQSNEQVQSAHDC